MLRLFCLSCRKISRFGVLRSFEGKIFLFGRNCRPQKYWMYFKVEIVAGEEKILSKPYKSLCETAQRGVFYCLPAIPTIALPDEA